METTHRPNATGGEKHKILLVDDEERLVAGIARWLRADYVFDLAHSGEVGLKKIRERGPYSAVVSDLRMPGMDGVEFLRCAKELAPDTVQLVLSGFADLQTAIQVVNEGNIFRYLTKPCTSEVIGHALQAAVEQYELRQIERTLYNRTFRGTLRILTEVMAITDPLFMADVPLVRSLVRKITAELCPEISVDVELAAMLCQLGSVLVPPPVLMQIRMSENRSLEQQKLIDRIPETSYSMLADIPRLQRVRELILYHDKGYDGSGPPAAAEGGVAIPLGSRILKAARAIAGWQQAGYSPKEAFLKLEAHSARYDPDVLNLLASWHGQQRLPAKAAQPHQIRYDHLAAGQTLAADVLTKDGVLLARSGSVVTELLVERIKNYAGLIGLERDHCIIAPSEGMR